MGNIMIGIVFAVILLFYWRKNRRCSMAHYAKVKVTNSNEIYYPMGTVVFEYRYKSLLYMHEAPKNAKVGSSKLVYLNPNKPNEMIDPDMSSRVLSVFKVLSVIGFLLDLFIILLIVMAVTNNELFR